VEDLRDRSSSRERALGLLYEAHAKGLGALEVIDQVPVQPDPFTCQLLGQVEEFGQRALELIGEAAVGWTLERMAVVDRLVLQLATCELLASVEPPVAVVLDEAVELAKTYSTDDSGRFVNGILSTVAREVRG
jgi:N utilization substance protein B